MKKKPKWQLMFGLLMKDHSTGEKFFHDIYPSKMQVGMCLDTWDKNDERIIPLQVREAKDGDKPTHWGWIDAPNELLGRMNENEEISMIFATETMLKICFPYGLKAEEERGKGRAVRVVVEKRQPSKNTKPGD